MKACTCFLLFGILAYTHSFASNTPKSSQRSVNLAIETVLEFSNKDKEVDANFLKNVENFLTKFKTVIDENTNDNNLRRNSKAPRVKTFMEFIQDVIRILNTYEDTAFADFFDILDEEIRNYHYRGCRFYELTENYEIRKFIAAKLDSIKGKPTSVKKTNINALADMLKDDNYDSNVKEIVNYINSLYKQEAGENFQKVITDLQAYGRSKSKRSNNNLAKIIKNGVRSIIFNHYTNLNTNVRRDVKQRIETFWKKINKKTPSMGNVPNVKRYPKSRNNVKNSENVMNEVMKPESVLRNKQIEVIRNHENNKNRTEIKQSEYKKAEMKRGNVKNEQIRYNYARKVTVDKPLDIQEEETILSSQHTDSIIDQRPMTNKHKTTQYIAIIPKKVSQKSSTNVTTEMPTNNRLKIITWSEESTGRVPKALLDKLTIKPSGHVSKHTITEESLNKRSHKQKKKYYDEDQKKWRGKIYETKYIKMYGKKDDKKRMTNRWLKNDTKHESRQKQKSKQDKKHKYDKTSEPNDPIILVHNRDFFKQNYVRTTDSVFNMEVHQYKKSMAPLKEEIRQTKRWSTASTKALKILQVLDVLMSSKSGKTIKSPARRTAALRVKLNEIRPTNVISTQQTSPPPPTNSSMSRLALAVPRAYSKRNKVLSWKPEWHFKKSAEQLSSSDEGMTVETFEIKDDNKRNEQNAKNTSSAIDLRIINLERQWNEVKSKLNVNTDVVAGRNVTHRYGANDDVVKRKQTKTTLKSDVNSFHNDYKVREDKLKMAGTADNKTKHMINNKYVKNEDSTINKIKNDIQNGKNSKTKLKSDVNMILNDFKDRTDKTKETGKPDNKTDVKDNGFKNKEKIFDYDNKIEKDTRQQEIIKKDKNPEISLINIVDVSPKAMDKGLKITMNDHGGDDASNETVTEHRKIASLSTSTKATESSTKTTMTVQHTVAVTNPTTLKLSSLSVSVPFATSPKLADVLQNAKFNLIVDESINKMIKNTSQVTDVSKNTLNVTKVVTSELLNKNVTNLQSDVTPTT